MSKILVFKAIWTTKLQENSISISFLARSLGGGTCFGVVILVLSENQFGDNKKIFKRV